MSNPVGRPCVYRKEMCERVVCWGREGCSWTEIACRLDIATQTLYAWRDTFPEFSDALMRARQEAQAWYEGEGRKGVWGGSDFNASTWAKQVSCRFPKDYRENSNINVNKTVKVSDEDIKILERIGIDID